VFSVFFTAQCTLVQSIYNTAANGSRLPTGVFTPPTRRDSTVSSRRRRRCVLGIWNIRNVMITTYQLFFFQSEMMIREVQAIFTGAGRLVEATLHLSTKVGPQLENEIQSQPTSTNTMDPEGRTRNICRSSQKKALLVSSATSACSAHRSHLLQHCCAHPRCASCYNANSYL